MTTTSFTELRGGTPARPLAAASEPDLASHDYVETEYAVHGRAHRYDDATSEADPFAVSVADTAPFCTRIIVRRPRDAENANATVLVEWLNVSSGMDTAPDWSYLAPEIVRSGYTWVGVSAQYTGVMGGESSVEGMGLGAGGLAGTDAQRYAQMTHPGDGYSYDMVTQVARALRSDDSDTHPLAGLRVDHLIAIGESQSAMALTTYVNRFAMASGCFDGFLLHSRSSTMLPLGEPEQPLDVDASYGGTPVRIRTDLELPVFVVQTETDVLTDLRYYQARQDDSDYLRVWEMAGTAHADFYQIGEYESFLNCPTPVNRGQQRFVLAAALHHLRAWVRQEDAPPKAAPLCVETTGGTPRFAIDELGNARGGVRTPRVEVASEKLSGIVTGDVPRVCVLFGSTVPIEPNLLRQRYSGRQDYLDQYAQATADAVRAGFILPADREAVIADANPEPIPD